MTQTLVKNHRLTLVWKTKKGVNNDNNYKRKSGDHPNYSTFEINQNTEKSLEETCCHSDSSEKLSANASVINSQRSK